MFGLTRWKYIYESWFCMGLPGEPVKVQLECAQSRNEVNWKRSTQNRANTREIDGANRASGVTHDCRIDFGAYCHGY